MTASAGHQSLSYPKKLDEFHHIQSQPVYGS